MPMNFPVKNIVKQHFNTNSLTDVAVESLEQVANEYPYDIVIQFLLAKKYKQLRHSGFIAQAAKASLYFNNPYWFTVLMDEEETEKNINLTVAYRSDENELQTATESLEKTDEVIGILHPTDIASTTDPTVAVEQTAAEDLIATLKERLQTSQRNAEQSTEESETSTALTVTEEVITTIEENLESASAEEIKDAVTQVEIQTGQTPDNVTEKTAADDLIATLKERLQAAAERNAEQAAEESEIATELSVTDEVITTIEEKPGASQKEGETEDHSAILQTEESVVTNDVPDIEDTTEQTETAFENAEKLLKDTTEHPAYSQQNEAWQEPDFDDTEIDATLEPPLEVTGSLEGKMKLSDIWKQPISDSDELIPLEPLHTIDYFASQGIKLGLNESNGQDKLSLKLKSFTEWLKTMKRIHPEKLDNTPEQVQTIIQHIAENSNKSNEVLTEAIAEVFARQGLKHKAIAVYEKLSLQNPDKSAFFAAKISKLNQL